MRRPGPAGHGNCWRGARSAVSANHGIGSIGSRRAPVYRLVDGVPTVAVTRADGHKCERCWRVVPEVSASADRAGLCPRCVDALAEAVSL